MSEGLKALRRVRLAHHVASTVMQLEHEDTETIEAIDTIEKELEDYKALKDKCFQLEQENLTLQMNIDIGVVLAKSYEKEHKALEIIKKYPKVRNSLQNFRYMVNYWQKNNVVVTTDLLRTYDFPYELEEYELLKEVLL